MVQAFIVSPEFDLDSVNEELVDLYESLDVIGSEQGYPLVEWLHLTDKILSPSVALDYREWAKEQWESTVESVNNA